MTFLTSGGIPPTSMIKNPPSGPIQTMSTLSMRNHAGIIIFPYGMQKLFWMVYRPRILASQESRAL